MKRASIALALAIAGAFGGPAIRSPIRTPAPMIRPLLEGLGPRRRSPRSSSGRGRGRHISVAEGKRRAIKRRNQRRHKARVQRRKA